MSVSPSYTPYQAAYFAHFLTREGLTGDGRTDGLTQSLSAARVDLNPHQVDAAMFAMRSPISKGVLLADEVGLGKTIEAALVTLDDIDGIEETAEEWREGEQAAEADALEDESGDGLDEVDPEVLKAEIEELAFRHDRTIMIPDTAVQPNATLDGLLATYTRTADMDLRSRFEMKAA